MREEERVREGQGERGGEGTLLGGKKAENEAFAAARTCGGPNDLSCWCAT